MEAIQFIGGWFKQIILVVLLAVFLEFLLPSQTMQKYARLLMGMVLVSVMLVPIGKILHLDMNTIEQQVLQFLQQTPSTESLSDIYQNANQIKQDEQLDAIDTWKQQIEMGMKQQIQEQFAVQVLSLNLDITVPKDGSVPLIQSVQMDVAPVSDSNARTTNGQDASSLGQDIQIVPVQPVQALGDADIDAAAGSAEWNKNLSANTLTKSEQALQEQIEVFVEQQFHLSKDSIHIIFEDAARG